MFHCVHHCLPLFPGPRFIFSDAAPDALALWVADMDLPCCPRICAALRERCDHPTFGYTYQPQELWEVTFSPHGYT